MKIFLAFLFVGLLVGCDCMKKDSQNDGSKTMDSPSQQTAKVESVNEKPASIPTDQAERILTEKDSKQTIEMKSGDQIKIRLNANATTGYSWKMSLSEGGDQIVALSEENYILPKSEDPQLVGVPGVAEYTITAKGSGSTTVSGIYNRSWEKPNPSDQRVEFKIDVK